MTRYEAIESKVWKNARTGATASIYGAVPYDTNAEAEGWAIVPVGFTIRDNVRGTVGIGRKPFDTMAEAEQVAADMEGRLVAKHEVPVSVAVGNDGRQTVLVTVRATLADANAAALTEAQRLGYADVKLFLEPTP